MFRFTRRPQNVCRNCGYRWYPRGHNLSSQCPQCGARTTARVPMPAGCGCLGILVVLIFLFGAPRSPSAPSTPPTVAVFTVATDTMISVPPSNTPAPVPATTTPDAATIRQRQAEGARATLVAGVLGTQTALAPTTRPTNTPQPTASPRVDIASQIKAVVTRVVQDVGAGLRDCTVDAAPLPTGRFAVAAVCGLDGDFMQDFGAKQAAFALHKALWTSGLPIGTVEVAIMSSVGAGPLVRARAGYTLMHTQAWGGVGPSVWVSFLQQFTRVGSDEDTVYYEHNP